MSGRAQHRFDRRIGPVGMPRARRVRADDGEQSLQIGLADAELGKVAQGADQIVEVDAGQATGTPDQLRLSGQAQAARVAWVRTLHNIGECHDLASAAAKQIDRHLHLAVDAAYLFALAQVTDDGGIVYGPDPIGEALAGAAAVETQDQAGPLRRAAVMHGIDAKTTAIPD